MKRTICIGFIFLFLFSSLTSCVFSHENRALAICGSYGVPGMFLWELKGGDYEVQTMERDSFGRIMFRFKAKNDLLKTQEEVFVICQKYDSDYVYFLEDYCYCDASAEAVVLDQWKQKNAWDQPLDIQKMSCRPNRVSLDLFIITNDPLDFSKVRKEVSQFIEETETEAIFFIDSDSIENTMYCVRLRNGEDCLVLVDSDYNVAILPLENQRLDPQIIADFKKQNGWVYGS